MEILDKESILKKKIDFGGIEDVSQKDLLTLLIGKGVCTKEAIEKSEKLIEKIGGIENFTPMIISRIPKLSQKDRLFLEALIEFSVRIKGRAVEQVEVVNNDSDIVKIFAPMIAHIAHEELWVVCLTSASRVIEKFLLSKGSENNATFDIKLLMKRILNNLSASVVLVHNHPSGDVLPSVEDKEITRDIKKALEYFDIILLDHVILSKDKAYSFANHKDL